MSSGPVSPTTQLQPDPAPPTSWYAPGAATWRSTLSTIAASTPAAVSAAANTPAAGAPTITGVAQVGETLTAGTAAITDGDGLTSVSYMYQWIRVATDSTETDIASTASTYTLVQADLGATIKVRVTFTNDANNSETLTSAATAAVSAAANTPAAASNGTVTQREDWAYYFRAADFNFSRGTGGGFTSLKITELPAVGRLTLNNVPINRFEVPKTIDLVRSSLRGLRYDPPDDAHGSPLATFKFKVNDGTQDSHIEYTMAVNITSVNDPAYGRPYIFGNTQVGHVIYGIAARVVGDDDGIPATLNYQWKRYSADGNTFEANIGTNSNTYRLAPSDRGKKVMVEVSFTDDSGYQETVRSRLSPPIPGQTVDEVTFQSIMGLGGDTFYDFTADHGQAFTTGTNPNGYTLSSVVIASEDAEADDVSVQICSVTSNGDPTTACTTLTAPGGGFAKGHLSFTAPANTTLTGNRTNYMVVIKSPGGQSVRLDATRSDGYDGTARASGWSLGTRTRIETADGWRDVNRTRIRIAILGTINP